MGRKLRGQHYKERKDKGDWSLPGYNYLGPGNKLDKGPPTDKNDRTAEKHDWGYDRIVRRGQDPYWNYNNDDRRAQRDFDHSSYGGTAGRAFFTGKRFAAQAGYIGDLDAPPHKKLRGSSIDPKLKQVALRSRGWSLNNLLREATSQQETRMASNGSDGNGSGQDGNLKETPVDPTPRYLPTGPEDYTFARLPYTQIKRYRDIRPYTADMAIRMTSPYDPEVNSNAVSGLGGSTFVVPNATDGGANTSIPASWFEFYAGMYRYYHVVETHWNIYIENLSGEPLYVHWMYYSDTQPPNEATNQDMMAWSECNTRILQPAFKGINTSGEISVAELPAPDTNFNNNIDESDSDTAVFNNYFAGNNIVNPVGQTTCQISGSYRPGQYKREIRLDPQVENWTEVNTNPSLQERLLVRFKPENPGYSVTPGVTRGDIIHCKIFLKVDYVVEFKELNPLLRWPVQRQPLTVTVTGNVTTGTA